MITYCMWVYIELSGKMVARIASGGCRHVKLVKNKALKKAGLDEKEQTRDARQSKERLQIIYNGPQGSMKSRNRHDSFPEFRIWRWNKLESSEK